MIRRDSLVATLALAAGSLAPMEAIPMDQHHTPELQRNVQTVRRHILEFWQEGRFEIADQIFDSHFVDRNPMAGERGDLIGYTNGARLMQEGFSQHQYEIVHLFAVGDLVVDHWILRAVNTGPFDGKGPTGRAVEFRGSDIFRMKDGKILEIWHVEELLQLYAQLGRFA